MANFNFNKVILGGRIVARPELKQTTSGVPVTSFTVAVNRRFGEKQADGSTRPVADFIKVTAWRQQAEFVWRYFDKGSSICVVGQIETRTWSDKQGQKQYATEVVADEVSFVDAKGEAPPTQAGAAVGVPGTGSFAGEEGTPVVPQFETIADDDELPF